MKTTKMSAILVLALGLTTEVANADFTFGTPTNLGPVANSPGVDVCPSISANGLSLFLGSNRPGGYGDFDLYVTTRAIASGTFGPLVSLGETVNGTSGEVGPSISADELSLFFHSRPEGSDDSDLYVTTRAKRDAPWGLPVNLGSTVNTPYADACPDISKDGLSLFFNSTRPGGSGDGDLYVTTRATKGDPWGLPVNLGSTVNTPLMDECPNLSADELSLFFVSTNRPGGLGGRDIWMTTRATKDDDWGTPVNLGQPINTSAMDWCTTLSADSQSLIFASNRPGGSGSHDLYQAPILPVVDLNGDGIVDDEDMFIIFDHWGENYSLCDIGPMPWGDGIVDVQDLIVLAEHLFEGIQPVEPEEVNVDEKDADSQVELEQGQILVVTLESNPTTGYRWEVAETQESILEQMGEVEFKSSQTGGPPLVGAGGWEIFRFKAISAGQMTLKLVYRRSWEEGVEPVKTFSLQVVVR